MRALSTFRKILSACVSAAAVSACGSLGSLPTLSNADVPMAFEQPAPAAAPIWPQADWWRGFESAELDSLIAAAQAENLDLAAAEARVLQADARVRQAGASLLPSVDLSADASQQKNFGSFGLGLGASYELDFWGRNRDIVTSAQAASKATRADRETVALTATAATASAYFQLLNLRERVAIARLNLETAQAVLAVTEARVRDGVATPLELAQQRAQIAAQQAAIPQLEQQELQTLAGLALLLGRPPEAFDVTAQDIEAIALPEVAPGLPAELLMRRPDVVAAEAGLESAHANVAAARAAFFPSIALTASGGLSSVALAGLISNPATSYSLGLSLAQTVFDAGRLTAQSDEAKAREQELLASYRGAAITAFSEVETSLGAIAHLRDQQAFQMEQVSQSELAFAIAQSRYREGVADYLTVLDSQRTLYQARDQLGLIKLQRLQAIVALYKALGGGWTDPAPGTIARN
jgi:NodT family efflux transporter outer membrane factor (OMF) lipoprotein